MPRPPPQRPWQTTSTPNYVRVVVLPSGSLARRIALDGGRLLLFAVLIVLLFRIHPAFAYGFIGGSLGSLLGSRRTVLTGRLTPFSSLVPRFDSRDLVEFTGRSVTARQVGGMRRERRQSLTREPDLALETGFAAAGGWLRGLMRVAPIRVSSGGRALYFGRDLSPAQARELVAELERRLEIEERDRRGVPAVPRKLGRYSSSDPKLSEPWHRKRVGSRLRRSTLILGGASACLIGVGAVVGAETGPDRLAAWVTVAVGAAAVILGAHWGPLARHRRRRLAANRAAHAREPWRWTRRWDAGRIERSPAHRLVKQLTGTTLVVVALVMWGVMIRDANAQLLMSVLGLVVVVPAALRAWNVFFTGVTEVRFESVPYLTGSPVTVHFAVESVGARFNSIAFTLRRLSTFSSGSLGLTDPVYCTHEGTYLLPPDTLPPLPGEQVSAHFEVPSELSGTHTHGWPRVEWDLVVAAETSCGYYEEAFPLPIYDPPDAADEAPE